MKTFVGRSSNGLAIDCYEPPYRWGRGMLFVLCLILVIQSSLLQIGIATVNNFCFAATLRIYSHYNQFSPVLREVS